MCWCAASFPCAGTFAGHKPLAKSGWLLSPDCANCGGQARLGAAFRLPRLTRRLPSTRCTGMPNWPGWGSRRAAFRFTIDASLWMPRSRQGARSRGTTYRIRAILCAVATRPRLRPRRAATFILKPANWQLLVLAAHTPRRRVWRADAGSPFGWHRGGAQPSKVEPASASRPSLPTKADALSGISPTVTTPDGASRDCSRPHSAARQSSRDAATIRMRLWAAAASGSGRA